MISRGGGLQRPRSGYWRQASHEATPVPAPAAAPSPRRRRRHRLCTEPGPKAAAWTRVKITCSRGIACSCPGASRRRVARFPGTRSQRSRPGHAHRDRLGGGSACGTVAPRHRTRLVVVRRAERRALHAGAAWRRRGRRSYKLATGEPVWRHGDAARFWESNGGAGPRGTPTLSNGKVYTFGATGILNVLDARDGRRLWSRNVASDSHTSCPTGASRARR